MDLRVEVERLRLDLLAVEISVHLSADGIPHALLKGPSTANWLYLPPRSYNDVDLLVPWSRLEDAVRGLEAAGLATAAAGRVGEEAQHSLLMLSSAGYEVDLHISLPTLPPDGDRVWDVLAPHVEDLDLGVGVVPALDEPARCLVLALHALDGGAGGAQPAEDLRRAREYARGASWQEAEALAGKLDAADLFAAGQGAKRMSPRAYLYASGAPSVALGIQRLRDAPRRDLVRLLWREAVPTRGFMRRAFPVIVELRFGLLRAHIRRWRGVVRQLPAALRSIRAARRGSRSGQQP